MVLSKSWSYFKEHFDLCPLYSSSQTALKWMCNGEISSYQWASIASDFILCTIFFSTHKFVILSSGRYFFPQAIPWLPPQC